MKRYLRELIPGLVAIPLALQAAEPWSDDRLTVVSGLEFWYDASHQNAGRATQQLPPLAAGNAVDYLIDGSGQAHHLVQQRREARPNFHQEFNGAFLSFDGKDDALADSGLGSVLTNLTVFIAAAPASNEGNFRAFFALCQAGRNDYTSGLNFDLGPQATAQLSYLNAEGSGFGGATQLLSGPGFPFRGWHIFALECQAGSIRLFVDGEAQGARDRADLPIRADEFVLGARHYSNTGEPPFTQGFFQGEIAELILYNRRLRDAERAAVHKYLGEKYGLLLGRPPEALGATKQLVTVSNPPPVQMLLPGFSVRELPLSLKNINNVKYREDGKLVVLGYNGQIHLLNDSDGDGLEDRVEPFWTNTTLRSPIGMALTPPGYARGQGVFVAAKGRVSLIVETNGARQEIIVAQGWQELYHGVDALGVAIDHEGNVFFGLGTASYTEPYQVDKATGQSRYDLKSERGTILKVSADFQKREIVCTGIRFSVALAFNQAGDLFCTDQEGATWLPNGNPFDELLHIQSGRHYGFPPRHPKYLPRVIDEPSVFDYAPQHQSTCGLNFNDPVNGGPVFGPPWWAGDAIVCGYSRGKIWRTKLVKTAAGYVAQNQLIAALATLTVDACVSPRGDLVVATHGGDPDWGSGPNGQGHLYQIRYAEKHLPEPVLAWLSSPTEIRVAFDRTIEPRTLKDLAKRAKITQGASVVAGDRFEVKRPGYAVVYSQLAMPRYDVAVHSVGFTPDLRTLILKTSPMETAVNYGITLPGLRPAAAHADGPASQHPEIDLLADLNGVQAHWQSRQMPAADPPAAATSRDVWLPHIDLAAARELTRASAEHESFWECLQGPGTLTIRGQLDVWQMLQPAIQSGSKLDYERPLEEVSVAFFAGVPFTIRAGNLTLTSEPAGEGRQQAVLRHVSQPEWLPLEVSLATGPTPPQLTLAWYTADDPRPRAFPLRRFFAPWAKMKPEAPSSAGEKPIPELAGGDWLRGKRIFFGDTVACYKCHTIRGEGTQVGPELSNLVHRDYSSVYRDISNPNAALNPDHLAYSIQLADGEEITALLQADSGDEIKVASAAGCLALPKSRIKSIRLAGVSLMPEGLDKALSGPQLKDLMTFLLTQPLEPAPAEAPGTPPPRHRAEMDAVLKEIAASKAVEQPPFSIVLCAGPKDHGPGEHDYPLWQNRWAKLLTLADGVDLSTAWEWPSAEQWQTARVIVFYSDNPGWNVTRAGELNRFLARGGGTVFIHWAVDGHTNVEALAQITGLAWRSGASKFRHGPLHLKLVTGPFTAGVSALSLLDESYWNLVGDLDRSLLIASAVEEGEPRPQMWAMSKGEGRVFVSIPGHYSWTFDDPLFRLLLLRGICWAGHQSLDRLSDLATVGARMAEDAATSGESGALK